MFREPQIVMKRQIRVQPNFVLFFIGTVIPERMKNTDYEHQRQKPSLEIKSLFNTSKYDFYLAIYNWT